MTHLSSFFPSVCHFASAERGESPQNLTLEVLARRACPGSGTVLAPDLSWLLFCELSSIWERNEHTGELVCQKSPKPLPKDYWSLFMRTTSQHPSIFSAFWNTIIKAQNTDIGSPLIIPFFPSSFSVGNSIFSNVKTLKYSLLGLLLVFSQEIMVIFVNLINY